MEDEAASTGLTYRRPITVPERPCKLSLCMRCTPMRLVRIGK